MRRLIQSESERAEHGQTSSAGTWDLACALFDRLRVLFDRLREPALPTLGLLLLVIVAFGLAGCNLGGSSQPYSEALEASGIIEAEDILISAQAGGRVLEVLVDEGRSVESGDLLLRLDAELLLAQRDGSQLAASYPHQQSFRD